MFAVEVRPSLRMLQQVATIERFCGAWERVSTQAQFTAPGAAERALLLGIAATAELDQTTSPSVQMQLRDWREREGQADYSSAYTFSMQNPMHGIGSAPPELRALFATHEAELEFNPALVELCHRALIGEDIVLDGIFSDQTSELDTSRFRRGTHRFGGPRNEVVFQTVPAFVIEQRLDDLLEWTAQELHTGRHHPLVIGGVFFLLFLQISPYDRANHRLAIVLLWHFLLSTGYTFVRFNHFATQFQSNSEQYVIALRQAEKTSYGNWSTLNSWLEFFLQALCVGCQELESVSELTVRQSRLSSIQRDIIEVIRSNGTATRERIVKDTGINISTVKYNLAVLSARGHLKREGGGRSTSYRLL